ncbi:MAG: apolipoprotein N-acyltransferase [Polyangiales bacterium]
MNPEDLSSRERLRRAAPWILAILGGTAQFLGFAGFDLYPLGFVCYVPLLVALELEKDARPRRHAAIGFLHGFVAYAGGYYWFVDFLDTWSGFPWIVCALLGSIFFAYQAVQITLLAVMMGRMRAKGFSATAALVPTLVAIETAFPMIFPTYLGNGLHMRPELIQVADLAGPVLVTAMMAAVNGAIADAVLARRSGLPFPWRPAALAAAGFAATLGYGLYRMHEVDARARRAPTVHMALVQVNMGTFEKDEDPVEGFRRHLEQSRRIERDIRPDLLVWPESAFTFFVPNVPNLKNYVLGELSTPTIFGTLARRRRNGEIHDYNTALLVDGDGTVLGSYDKVVLIPFGEYLPLGDLFPAIYDLSPNTGMFTPGFHMHPLVFRGFRMSTLICYEDLLPDYVRRAVHDSNPHVLVNLTNDAWYGNTNEPWIHLALAKFRAVEHHRALVRSTNSGVSAFVDPVGRVVAHTGVYTREDLDARVPMMTGRTVFETVGEYPGWVVVLLVLYLQLFARRDRLRSAKA